MGREGEVVAELVPEFERTHPGIHVEVQQLPWSAAHEKLLTAFAGDATPDLCQLGNTWIPEFVALDALEPLDAYARGLLDDPSRAIISPASGTPTSSTASSTACRGTSTRASCSTAATSSRKPGTTHRRDRGPSGPPCSPRSGSATCRAARDRAAGERVRAAGRTRLQQDDPLLRDGGRYGNFRSGGFARAFDFYARHVPQRLRATARRSRSSNMWNEFGRGHFVFYISGPWNIGEFQRRLPAEPAAKLDDGAAARPRRAGRLDRGRLEPRDLPQCAQPGRRVAVDRIPVATRRAAALPRAHRRLAAATLGVERRRARRRRLRAGVSRAARARQADARRCRSGSASPPRSACVAERVVHGDLTVAQAAAELDARTDRILEKRRWMLARKSPSVNRTMAAWWFVAPALVVIAVFFVLPVLAALIVSFTDFDIYALADLRNLRFVGLRNYVQLLETPLFWQALGNTLYFVVVGVPLSIGASLGAALLLNSPLARFKELLSHGALLARGHDARRGRRHLAVSVQHALRVDQLRARPPRHRAHRLAGRSALGDARDHPVRGVEELRLQHGDPARGAAEHPAGAVRGGAHRRRIARPAVSLHHAADARADPRSWSAS